MSDFLSEFKCEGLVRAGLGTAWASLDMSRPDWARLSLAGQSYAAAMRLLSLESL